ncbi:DUF6932 family protein [Amycolatopsis umgeniensis]
MLPSLERSDFDPSQLVLPWSDTAHPASWDEMEKLFGHSPYRRSMLLLARSRLERLAAEGIPLLAVWINGSFVTGSDKPNDLDALVLIDALAWKSCWPLFGGPSGAGARIHTLECDERYEPGGTKLDHLTDFKYLMYFPPDTAGHAVTVEDLDVWHENWSRLRLPSPKQDEEGRLVEDAKGFVEVRWSS